MKKFIRELKPQEEVQAVFLLKKKELQKTKGNKPYLKLSLCDRTGVIEARVWDNAELFDARIDAGDMVWVKSTAELWQDVLQLKVDDVRLAAADEYRLEDIVRTVEDRDALLEKVKRYLGSGPDTWLTRLTKSFLEDDVFMKRFIDSPGARSWHNAYIGGLLEHTYEVMVVVDTMCGLYPDADRQMCLLGAFLHDIGKITEIDPKTFEYTLEGNLLGHLPIGFEMLCEKIGAIKNFPKARAALLKHIVLSHHGEYEQQSPVLPKTLEATVIYHADELASQANAVKELIQAQRHIGKVWSGFVNIKNRRYLLQSPKENA